MIFGFFKTATRWNGEKNGTKKIHRPPGSRRAFGGNILLLREADGGQVLQRW
jgi:hypothetical protein